MSRRRRPPCSPALGPMGTGTVSAGIDARSARCRGHAARPWSPRADGSVAPAPPLGICKPVAIAGFAAFLHS